MTDVPTLLARWLDNHRPRTLAIVIVALLSVVGYFVFSGFILPAVRAPDIAAQALRQSVRIDYDINAMRIIVTRNTGLLRTIRQDTARLDDELRKWRRLNTMWLDKLSASNRDNLRLTELLEKRLNLTESRFDRIYLEE